MRIVVLTCDKYNWLVPLFFHFLEKNWPDNPYPVDIITEKEPLDYKSVFYTHGDPWASGILNYINQAKDDKFLLIPEDYVIKSPVNTARVKKAEKLCSENIGCVRLNQLDKYFRFAQKTDVKGYREYPLDRPYSMSMQTAIRQKKYIKDVFRYGEDAWQAEIKGSQRLKGLKRKWRILWTKSAIIDYQAGGFMVAGRPRASVVKWVIENITKGGEK